MIQLLVVAVGAFCAATTQVSAVPSFGTTRPTTSTEPPKDADSFDPIKEKNGFFTSGWTRNTMKCFKRVEAVVEICIGIEYFIRYADEEPGEYEKSVYAFSSYISSLRLSLCSLERQHVRDNRNGTSVPISVRENVIYIKSSANNTGETYALSKEVVWQLEIPRNYGAYLELNPLNLQAPSLKYGKCIDYVAVHFHGPNSKPKVLCGQRDIIHIVNIEASKLTIKFVSDESVNQGGFHGGLLIFPAVELSILKDHGMTPMSMMSSRSRRYLRGGSDMGPISIIKPSSPVTPTEPSGADCSGADCEPVESPAQSESESKSEPELETELEETQPHDQGKELNSRAMWCFSDIVQNGFHAAVKYLKDSSPQCQMFAKVFLQDDYVAPL